jgi:integral membrane protein
MTGTTGTSPETTEGALFRYRVMAYVVGTLLVLLVCLAVPLKYAADEPTLTHVLGVAHGYLYMALLLTIADLWRRRRFPLSAVVLVALAGTVPFLSFVAERAVTTRVRDGRF